MPVPFSVALTGGIGSGKSTVANLFSDFGVPIIDSDIIAREIVEPGKPAYNQIVKTFSQEIISKNGTLDRKKLADIVFNDDKARTTLEKIMHPIVYQNIEQKISKITYPYCIIVIPLLIETGAKNRFDRILLIDISEKSQIERTANRDNLSSGLVRKIIKSQAKRNERLKYADDIIDNNVKIEELRNSVEFLHKQYLNLCTQN